MHMVGTKYSYINHFNSHNFCNNQKGFSPQVQPFETNFRELFLLGYNGILLSMFFVVWILYGFVKASMIKCPRLDRLDHKSSSF